MLSREEKNQVRAQFDRPTVLRMRALERRIVGYAVEPEQKARMIRELQALRDEFESKHRDVTEQFEGPDRYDLYHLKKPIRSAENIHIAWYDGKFVCREDRDRALIRLPELYREYAKFFSIDDPDTLLERIRQAHFDFRLQQQIAKETTGIIAAAVRASGVDHLVQVSPVDNYATDTGVVWDGLLREEQVFGTIIDTDWKKMHTVHIARLEALPPVGDEGPEILKSATRLARASLLCDLKKELADSSFDKAPTTGVV